MTQEAPERPPVGRVVLGLIDDYVKVSHPLLVSMVAHETRADAERIESTVARLERNGTIYNTAGDPDAPVWKVTRP